MTDNLNIYQQVRFGNKKGKSKRNKCALNYNEIENHQIEIEIC